MVSVRPLPPPTNTWGLLAVDAPGIALSRGHRDGQTDNQTSVRVSSRAYRPGRGSRSRAKVVRISGVDGLELVIFDCDGVLVDSERISNAVLARMLTEEGMATTLAEARRDYQGLLLSEVVSQVQARLDRSLLEGWIERFERDRAEVFHRELRPVPGAADAVARVSAAGVAVCVASQGKAEKTRLSLGLTGLRGLFPGGALFSAYSVPRGKPHPDLFLHAAASMGARPSGCVVIEDIPSGVAAAVAAGMRVFGYAADSDEMALRHAGAEILRSLEDLPALLGLELDHARARSARQARCAADMRSTSLAHTSGVSGAPELWRSVPPDRGSEPRADAGGPSSSEAKVRQHLERLLLRGSDLSAGSKRAFESDEPWSVGRRRFDGTFWFFSTCGAIREVGRLVFAHPSQVTLTDANALLNRPKIRDQALLPKVTASGERPPRILVVSGTSWH